MARFGRKLVRFGNMFGRKIRHNRAFIGRAFGGIGKGLQAISPFLAAIPALGPAAAATTALVGAGVRSSGRLVGAHNGGQAKRAGQDLARTYGAYKASRRS